MSTVHKLRSLVYSCWSRDQSPISRPQCTLSAGHDLGVSRPRSRPLFPAGWRCDRAHSAGTGVYSLPPVCPLWSPATGLPGMDEHWSVVGCHDDRHVTTLGKGGQGVFPERGESYLLARRLKSSSPHVW